MSVGYMNRIEDLNGNPLWDSEEGLLTQVSSSTGTQLLPEALDQRINKGEIEDELVTTQVSPVSLKDRFSEYVTPKDFGGVGDGITDDSDSVENALVSGKPVYFGGAENIWKVTRPISVTLTSPLVIRSDGASIIVDTPDPIQNAISIFQQGNFIYWEGPLLTNCQQNSFRAWYILNPLDSDRTSIYMNGYCAENIYRSSTDFSGGDGIWIQGAYEKVILNNLSVKNVTAALGAIIPLTQGVAGVTITRSNTEETDASFVSITNFHIENIYSEDEAEKFDQDAIRVFSVYSNASDVPTQAYCTISKGKIKNSNGRAIKLQTEWADVSDINIVRDGFPYGSGYIGNQEIDFQTGGGNIDRIQLNYRNAFPRWVFQFTPTRSSTRANPTTLNINNIIGLFSGTGQPEKIVNITVDGTFTDQISLNVDKVDVGIIKTYGYFLEYSGDAARWYININNIIGRPLNNYVYRSGNTPVSYVNARAVHAPASAVTLFGSSSVGNTFIDLSGANRNVTL